MILVSGTGSASGATPWAEGGLQAQSAGDLRLPLRRTEGLAADQAPAHHFLLRGDHRPVDAIDPVGRSLDGPCAQLRCRATAGRSSGEPPLAAPWPVLGPRYHTSPQGVALHVPPVRDEVAVVPDRERLEAALVEVPVPAEWWWPCQRWVCVSVSHFMNRESSPLTPGQRIKWKWLGNTL